MALTIGITGGIGSGKTTVCRIFESLGIPIYYADDRAKKLMVENSALIQKLTTAFGAAIYSDDGQLNRALLASIVFNDQPKLDLLNSIVHPAVAKDGIEWMNLHQSFPYIIKEAALLFESGSYKSLDQIIVVTAPEKLRIARVVERDQIAEEAVKARIDKQWPEEEKIALANHLILNDGTKALVPQVWALHQLFNQPI